MKNSQKVEPPSSLREVLFSVNFFIKALPVQADAGFRSSFEVVYHGADAEAFRFLRICHAVIARRSNYCTVLNLCSVYAGTL